MRKLLLAALLLLAPLSFAAGFKKPYFAATKPGTWAKYSIHSVGPDGTTFDYSYTYTRLADEDGKVRFEIRTELKDSPTSMNRYTLNKGFDVDHELLDYATRIESGLMSAGEEEPQPMEPVVLSAIATHAPRYATQARLLGKDTVSGKSCDHYSYVARYEGDPVQIETGELWLDDSVPFGVVRQKASTKDPKGTVLSSYDEILTDSGARK